MSNPNLTNSCDESVKENENLNENLKTENKNQSNNLKKKSESVESLNNGLNSLILERNVKLDNLVEIKSNTINYKQENKNSIETLNETNGSKKHNRKNEKSKKKTDSNKKLNTCKEGNTCNESIKKVHIENENILATKIPDLLISENNKPNKEKILTLVLLFVNYILYLISKIIGYRFKTKQHELPPIVEPILLLSATEITKKIKNNTFKCEHIVRIYIDRIRAVQKKINAMVDNSFTAAIKEAKKIDEDLKNPELAKKLRQLPLLGVPFTCKNSIAIKGLAFDSGSYYRKGVKAEEDAQVIKNLRAAGAIPLALTNVPEFVLWWDSDNKVYGRTCNPYDLSRIAGGSSGGEGSLIASAGSILGVGSDVGGSIRIPSMFNGIFGHKTTLKYIPVQGMFPEPPESFFDFLCFGPLCRYAVDLPLVLSAMSGGQADELQLDKPVDFKKLKIYYMEWDGGNPLSTIVDKRILEKMHDALNYFSKKYGIKTEKISINKFKYGLSFFGTCLSESKIEFSEMITCGNGRINLIFEIIKSIFGLSKHTLSILIQNINQYMPICNKNTQSYKKVVKILNDLKPKVHELLSDNAVLFYPTWPTIAPKHQTTILRGFDANYTVIFNAMSIPATHVPMGLTKEEGLPLGFTIAAGPGQDRLSIAFAKEIEKEFGGWVCPS